jgi:hypothetical protein
MKLKIFLALGALLLIAALIYGYLLLSKERTKEAAAEKPVSSESKVGLATNGEAVVNLDEKTQKLIGLETTPLTAATLTPQIKSYGRVLDPSPLVGLLSSLSSTRAALEASAKDYHRVKALFSQGENASARALETAEAAMKRDQIALNTAEAQFASAWGKTLAGQPDLAAFVHSLAAYETVLVRLDLPAGELLRETPTGGRLVLPGALQPIQALLLGPAPTTDPQVQGQGFLLLATNLAGRLASGLAITGFLLLPGEPLRGVTVPETAMVRAADRAWVFVQTSATTFVRRDVKLDHPMTDGWFVDSGISPNDRVVTTGAQTLLSEERKSQIQVGD